VNAIQMIINETVMQCLITLRFRRFFLFAQQLRLKAGLSVMVHYYCTFLFSRACSLK
jgi:hypothetical protein